MALWPTEPAWTPPSTLNKGNEYTSQDGVTIADMNAIIENLIYLYKYGGGSGAEADFTEIDALIGGGGDTPTEDSVKAKIQSLITEANNTTGKSDTDLTSAMLSLAEGYGQGGGGITTATKAQKLEMRTVISQLGPITTAAVSVAE